mmetsp:Transcript_31644/g.41912  ORF Transcript_31644/g.41912 Transcript_31644/m.41912 type:complete len:252 (+) Transcript_31644:665-1420(+)|eukprot:CAMPEP_0185584624 /NCGR_PEP_ID=MMETSP0434-20130131/33414_1 /TAXON_ID=626734 ORGANISM="Favella taraikaensis, Strain Fe Narragansett Bay" /NCGR_SAMPLE_ID=MMETSP0434 /ASSEMBLY_ACC=CAM_ASM_000379 /LENGTH=251 /DNA_ID=CAMNT_0028204491 /DNA_START=570 /DNA_END=1325 /DNA_ORIENTATION=+
MSMSSPRGSNGAARGAGSGDPLLNLTLNKQSTSGTRPARQSWFANSPNLGGTTAATKQSWFSFSPRRSIGGGSGARKLQRKKTFQVKVIKDRAYIDEEEIERKLKEGKEAEERERQAREVVVHILMEHGVTSAHASQASYQANQTVRMMQNTVTKNKQLIREYEQELLSHRQRLAVMEQTELTRMADVLVDKEEKAANHGKSKNFFKAPALSTSRRKKTFISMRPGSLGLAEKHKEQEWTRALNRGSKYVI